VETAARRIGGYLWESADDRRLIFLGADFAARAGGAPAYGADSPASVAGLFERTGDFRYRLAVPGSGGTLDIWELVAAPAP
jgi:hypothetical protein